MKFSYKSAASNSRSLAMVETPNVFDDTCSHGYFWAAWMKSMEKSIFESFFLNLGLKHENQWLSLLVKFTGNFFKICQLIGWKSWKCIHT
jgi:hypothetical protein